MICKDWLSFGYRFQLRTGHGDPSYGNDMLSPVFILWLDCMWQLMHQFPRMFAFTPAVLMEIADELYSCRYGTFLCNCEKERLDAGLAGRTNSLWASMLSRERELRNPFYDRTVRACVHDAPCTSECAHVPVPACLPAGVCQSVCLCVYVTVWVTV